jgi:hypothetical protein
MSRVRELHAALRASHRRLTEATDPMSPARLDGPSYCTDWSVAQVLSHVGSQAEIFSLYLDAVPSPPRPRPRSAFRRRR